MGIRERYELVPEDDPGFCQFWEKFPRRVAKKDARRAWAQLKPDAAMTAKILRTLEWQVALPQWTKDGGQYVPYPASYLRGRRFDDEMPMQMVRVMSESAALVFATLGVKP